MQIFAYCGYERTPQIMATKDHSALIIMAKKKGIESSAYHK